MPLSYMMTRLKSKGLVAVDWSDYFLRIVVLRKKTQGYELVAADSAELEHGMIENGQIVDFAGVAESLLELLKRHKIKHKQAAFVVNGANIISKRLRFDEELTEAQIHDEIVLDFNKHVSYPPEETFYDFEVQTKEEEANTRKQEVLFIAAHKDQIAQYEQLAKICRLRLEVIDIDNYVLQRFVEIFYPEEKQDCWALICLNFKRFKLHILDENQIYFSEQKTISAGLSEAEYLNAVNAWLMRNMQMFEVSNRGKKPQKIVLYGDHVEIDNIIVSFKEMMQLDVTILDPFTQLNNAQVALDIKHKASYLLTIALATRPEVN
ncbi:type IV pilus biogenesis protein PilM [Cysteiniphilum halobium]|uniref:type IV pilus biogenesis protein PilM n=1 Tax=Cysteiniphilum halobium TaxID=2219059 RepID=UPI000E64C6D0|nr:pilus assembly protein PilM [Cysteiniphilum halobium]